MREADARLPLHQPESERRMITEIALRMLSMGLSHEQVAEGVGITVEQVQDIAGMKGV